MEQAVWVFVGVVSVILGIGIVIKVLDTARSTQGLDDVIWAIEKLETNLNFVCRSPVGTKIVTEVNLPSGTTLDGEDDRICIKLQEDIRCRYITCDINPAYQLDLDTDEAHKAFKSRPYGCAATKQLNNEIVLECQG